MTVSKFHIYTLIVLLSFNLAVLCFFQSTCVILINLLFLFWLIFQYLSVFIFLKLLLYYIIYIYIFFLNYYIFMFIINCEFFLFFLIKTTSLGVIILGAHFTKCSWLVCLLILSLTFFIYYFMLDYLLVSTNITLFLLFLLSFICSMLLLFIACDIILILIAWECIGWFSYLLITYFGYKFHASRAALKTYLFAKFSDCCLIFSCCYCFYLTGTTLLPLIIYWIQFFFISTIKFSILIGFFFGIFLATLCKSAQLIFMVWLTDAMEAPTPASAFIHSSTLVIAGVYLLLQFYGIWIQIFLIRMILLFISGISASFAALLACVQTDIKRLIAFSTISQIAYLYVSVCMFNPTATFLYLWLHAINKAILFILCGYMIHFCNGLTTLRRCGGLYRFLIFFFSYGLVILFNLTGVPGFVGFFYKELFLNQCLTSRVIAIFIINMFCLSFSFTFFYLYKLFFFTFFSYPKITSHFYSGAAILKVIEMIRATLLYINTVFTLNSILKYFYFWHILFFIGHFLLYYYYSVTADFHFFYFKTFYINHYISIAKYLLPIIIFKYNQMQLICFWIVCVFTIISLFVYFIKFYLYSYTFFFWFCMWYFYYLLILVIIFANIYFCWIFVYLSFEQICLLFINSFIFLKFIN